MNNRTVIKLTNDALTAEAKYFNFMDWVAHLQGQYGCSSPSTKGLYDKTCTYPHTIKLRFYTFLQNLPILKFFYAHNK